LFRWSLYNAVMKAFLQELRKRHVVKVAIAYLVAAWVVLQLADVIFPALGLPEWSITLVLALLAVGFPAALIISWVFDVTPNGIQRTDETPDEATSLRVAPPVNEKSIAVLPFPDMSAEQDQGHFCDGLTEELLNVFTTIPGLRVASRTSCFALKGKDIDLPSAAARLGVAHVLEGSVRKAGNKVRITAQLIEASTDSHLWSETYDRELDDIFAIQDDIAERILNVLKLKLGDVSLPDPTTHNARAYEYFLRGRGYLMTFSQKDNERAIELFKKAADSDPEFLRAWSSLAEAYASRAIFFGGGDIERQAAMQASDKAIQIEPDHAQTHLARGYAHLANSQYEKAHQDFLRVAELAPQKFEAYYQLGRLAQHQGDTAGAIENFTRAMELNPYDYESPCLVVASFQKTGDESALRHYAKIGVDRARQHLEDYPDNPRAYYLAATAFIILDQLEEGREWAEKALSLAPDDPSTRYNVACFFAQAGDIERAMDLLENSIFSRAWIENDPELDPLREHPRYKALIESLRLREQSNQS
jgi:adenylate cyclase